MSALASDASQIRVMRQADLDAVAAIELRAYAFPWTAGIFRDCLRVGHECWVLDCRAGIIGYGDSEARTFVHVTTGDLTMPVPSRLAGDDRYETGVEISQQGFPDGADVVYVASGQKFPDGLAAAPAAARDDAPLLLTRPNAVPESVLEEIERLTPDTIVIVGGEPSVSAAVADELDALAGEVIRLGGDDRYETSRLIAQHAFPEGSANAFIATGRNFPDALSAGAAAGSISRARRRV